MRAVEEALLEYVQLIAQDLAGSERWIIRNGIGIQIMETLAVGAFLTALAVSLGASNWVIGLLASVPHLAQLAQIPALAVLERSRRRRTMYLISGAVARPMLLIIGVAALLNNPGLALSIIVVAFAVRYAAGAFLSCAWNSWMRDLVPDGQMGRLFGERQKKMIGIGIVFSLLAAGFIDLWRTFTPWPETWAFAVVYSLAFLGGAYSTWAARYVHEPPMPARPQQPAGIMSRLAEPFSHSNYRRLIGFLASWNFAVNLAAPFFVVLMLRKMQFDLVWVIGFATLSQIAAYFSARRWGLAADRYGNKAVLRICAPLFVLAIFTWTFTTMPDVHPMTIPMLVFIHVATGVASAGVNLASGNIALKLAPHGDAAPYVAASAMTNALAAGVAAVFGGLTADLFASWELSLTVRWHDAASAMEFNAMNFTYWDFFFVFATLIGLYALHRLSYVSEEGEVSDKVVKRAMIDSAKQSLRNLSTIAGLRSSSDFPLEMIDEPPADATPDG